MFVRGQLDAKLIAQFRKTPNHLFHLDGIEFSPLIHNHVVGPAQDSPDGSSMGPPTCTFFGGKAGQVIGPITDHGYGLFCEVGHHEDSHFPGLAPLLCIGVYYLDEDMILHPMKACLLLTLRGNGGSNFGQSVVVEGVDSQALLDLLPSGGNFSPSFPPKASST